MSNELARLDPDWAWSPYEPGEQAPWNLSRAAHLFRRAGFGGRRGELQQALTRQPVEVVRQLLEATEPDSFRNEQDELAQAMVNTGQVRNLAAVWLHRMLATPHQLQEKFTLFWHGHFATSAAKVTDAQLMLAQNQLLRRHALGRFDELVQEISRDPAMLIYLDSATNRKSHPNENYAREVMELFCLGEGNYTEGDIRELARCFTGWQVKRRQFRFSAHQHDAGEKKIFGRTASFSGEQAVQWVLEQAAAPRLVVRKLVRFLVCDEQELPARLIDPLARQLRENDFHIGSIVQRILSSQLFFSSHAMAQKIRSPVELACGLLRALEGSTNTLRLAEQLAEVGQSLFFPPNVKGWDGGRAWINSATLLGRANLVHELLHSEKTRFAGGSLAALLQREQLDEPGELLQWLEEMWFAVSLPQSVRDGIMDQFGQDKRVGNEWATAMIHVVMSLPESQLA